MAEHNSVVQRECKKSKIIFKKYTGYALCETFDNPAAVVEIIMGMSCGEGNVYLLLTYNNNAERIKVQTM